jgi:hypothetical protein
LGSHCGEGARGDRREAAGGKTTDCGETVGFHPGVTLAGEESKFGMLLKDAVEAYRLAKQ